MTLFQDELLFPVGAVPAAGPLGQGAEEFVITGPSGDALHGVHIAPAAWRDGPATLVLGFGGNAWNGQHVAEYLHEAFPAADVIAFHYRGYAPSGGSPSADALLEDAPAILDAARRKVEPGLVIAVGFSIGSGVAASLAAGDAVDGIILVTPFDSLKKVAAQLYPWLPVTAFFRHEMDLAMLLRGSRVPLAIIAAGDDRIIPPERTNGLRLAIPAVRFDRTIAGAGHNDIYGDPRFRKALGEALEAVAGK